MQETTLTDAKLVLHLPDNYIEGLRDSLTEVLKGAEDKYATIGCPGFSLTIVQAGEPRVQFTAKEMAQ